ncbi:MAG: hypothetical protein ABI743_10610, partial [bacterium]
SQDMGTPDSDDDLYPHGDSGGDSGEAEDEYWYDAKVAKPDDYATTPGTYTGVVCATDAAIATETPPIALHTDLTPVTANAPVARTYLPFTVQMVEGAIGDGWAKQLTGIGEDAMSSMVTTATGECYVAGTTTGPIDFGLGEVTPPHFGTYEILVAKLDALGAPLWLKAYGSNGFDSAGDLALDSSGNLYLTGGVGGDSIQFDPLGPNHTVTGGTGGFLLKVDPNGDYLWSRVWSAANGGLEGSGVAVTTAGEIVATGNYLGTVDFGPAGTLPNDSVFHADGYLLALNSSGLELRTGKIGGTMDAYAWHCAAQPDGSIAVGGYFNADLVLDGSTTRNSLGDMDTYIVNYDPTGFTRNWDHEYGSVGRDDLTDVASLKSGYLGIVGTVVGPTNFGAGTVALPNAQDSMFVVTYSPTGAYNWSFTAEIESGSTLFARGRTLVGDSRGDVYVMGSVAGQLKAPLTSYCSNGDNLIVKLSPTGGILWERHTGAFRLDDPGDCGLGLDDNLVYAYTFTEITAPDPENSTAFINSTGNTDGMVSMILRDGNW